MTETTTPTTTFNSDQYDHQTQPDELSSDEEHTDGGMDSKWHQEKETIDQQEQEPFLSKENNNQKNNNLKTKEQQQEEDLEEQLNQIRSSDFYEPFQSFFFNGQESPVNWNVLANFSGLQQTVRRQLRKVYYTLTLALGFAALGSFMYIKIMHIPVLFSFLMSFALVITLSIRTKRQPSELPHIYDEESRQQGHPNWWIELFNMNGDTLIDLFIFFGFAFFSGLHLGPLLEQAFEIDPRVVYFAFIATCLIFGSFSVASHFAKRRSMLYLGSFAFSILSIMLWTMLFHFIFGGLLAFNTSSALLTISDTILLYGGLIMFCLFVIVDTQIIIERCHVGDRNFVRMALELFLDFFAIFVRILIILMRNTRRR